jgi:hypothetical protein
MSLVEAGYVVDHVIPLACGGDDVSGNMRWQTVATAKSNLRKLDAEQLQIVEISAAANERGAL